jgi:hypothetical protein
VRGALVGATSANHAATNDQDIKHRNGPGRLVVVIIEDLGILRRNSPLSGKLNQLQFPSPTGERGALKKLRKQMVWEGEHTV